MPFRLFSILARRVRCSIARRGRARLTDRGDQPTPPSPDRELPSGPAPLAARLIESKRTRRRTIMAIPTDPRDPERHENAAA